MGIKTPLSNRSINNFHTNQNIEVSIPDYSELEVFNSKDRVLERAYTIASLDARRAVDKDDILKAMEELHEYPDDLINQFKLDRKIANVKIVRKSTGNSHVIVAQPLKTTENASSDETPEQELYPTIGVADPTKNTFSSTIPQKINQAIQTVAGVSGGNVISSSVNSILAKYPNGQIENAMVGRYQEGTSDKYYVVFHLGKERALAFWGRVGNNPQSKLYEPPYDKKYSALLSEKIRKGYKAIANF